MFCFSRPAYCSALLLVATGAVSAWSAESADDMKLLAGKWKPIEASLGDNTIDPMLLESASLVYDGDKYTIHVNNQVERGSIVLDAAATPKTMDIFPTEGNNNGKTLLAIYRIDGDRLTICYSITPTVRPDDFEANSNTLLVVKYERVKE